jgi:hypothetical protein
MIEPTIISPKCEAEIKRTESLEASLMETTHRDYDQRLYQMEADNAGRKSYHTWGYPKPS